jgi:hypothetical protein
MVRLDQKSLKSLLKNSKNPQLLNLLKNSKIRKHKYNAQVTVFKGIKFKSKHQAKVYAELLLFQKLGIVKMIMREPILNLTETVSWHPDFYVICKEGITDRIIEAKGVETKDFKIKYNLTRELHPDIIIDIVKTNHKVNL